MKYYLAAIDGHRKLFPWEKDIPKGVEAQEIDVPTDKEGLMGAIQELITEADEAQSKVAKVSIDPEAERPFKPTGIAPDGHPVTRGAWTAVQLESMFKRRSEHVQDLCHAISKLKGAELGYVAYQVAAQLVSPVTIIEPTESEG